MLILLESRRYWFHSCSGARRATTVSLSLWDLRTRAVGLLLMLVLYFSRLKVWIFYMGVCISHSFMVIAFVLYLVINYSSRFNLTESYLFTKKINWSILCCIACILYANLRLTNENMYIGYYIYCIVTNISWR